MGANTQIQWTDHTWNPWHGCKKVSPGCKYCYMYRDKERYKQDPTTVIRSKTFNDPLRWQRKIDKNGFSRHDKIFPGMKVFTCSWSDFFIQEADDWRPEAWDVIKQTPYFHYQILTKRPERIRLCLPPDWGAGYPNVWLGITAENNEVLYDRYFALCDIPAKTRFLSIEPLIDQVDLLINSEFLDWVIVGGESGNDQGKYRYRPCKVEWIRKVVRRAKHSDVSVFVKQLGTHLSKELGLKDRHGGNIDEWPEDLRIREFPYIF